MSKFLTLQPRKQTIATPILPNISRSKGNQIMSFDQLIEFDMRNIFLEKSYTEYDGERIPRPCSIKQISVEHFSGLVF